MNQLEVLNNKIIIGLIVLGVEFVLVIFVLLVPDPGQMFSGRLTEREESDMKGNCEQEINCRLPDCYCSTFDHQMSREDIPQMVYFAFDDGVTAVAADHYHRLFRPDRRNPNGCPIVASLYISDQYTDYGVLPDLYKRGFEMAVHSVTHTEIKTGEKVRTEAMEERNNIAMRSGIPKDEIVGWRSPSLITAGDKQDSVLKDLGFEYDISLTYTRMHMNDSTPWPFTMDFAWPFTCHIPPCPSHTHRGLWEVPVNSMRDYRDEFSCVYVDGCLNRAHNVEEAYQYLLYNFYDNYYGSRAPFGFNMHYAWLLVPSNMEAMDRIIQEMLKHDDVYIITVKHVIDWMKHPTALSNITNFEPWSC